MLRSLASIAVSFFAAVASAQSTTLAENPYVFSEDFEDSASMDWWFGNTHIASPGECGNASRVLAANDGPGACTFTHGYKLYNAAGSTDGVGFHATWPMEVHFRLRFELPSATNGVALTLWGGFYDGYINLAWYPPNQGTNTWQDVSFVYQHTGWEPDNPAGSGGFPGLQIHHNVNSPITEPGGAFFDDILIRPTDAGVAICTGSACPCGNDAATWPIARGCENSTGKGAWLHAYGDTSVASDELEVVAFDLPEQKPMILFEGTSQVNGGAGQAFGDGLRCVGGAIQRIEVANSGNAGERTWQGLANSRGWSSGQTVLLQAYYRDTTGPCGAGFNTTNGYAVTLTP